VDDPFGKRLAEELGSREMHTFGQSPAAEWVISNIELSGDRTRFVLSNEKTIFPVETNLIGEHNVYNLTGAILAVRNYGLSWDTISYALSQEITVPGRLQKFTSATGADFYVDYAHSDDALRNVLDILRKISRNKLTVVFGAGGDRDRTKRPRMGKVAAEMADSVILTSDNPRTEDPMQIIQEIAAGIPGGKDVTIEPDRRKAIAVAVQNAKRGDIVLIAGKGHENYQVIGTEKTHLDDREVIADLLKKQAASL
jgi:UDP-N-acetylmuramoyl-L-alanyl-D-glutamate--2,6-diaminopimelate ligase